MNLKKIKELHKKTIAIKKGFGKKLKNTEAISLLSYDEFLANSSFDRFKKYFKMQL